MTRNNPNDENVRTGRSGVHSGAKWIPNQPNAHPQNACVHSFQFCTSNRVESASLRTAPKLVNSVSAPPTIPTQVNSSYLNPLVSNAAADGSTDGLANCAMTAALILSFSLTFSVCKTSNGGGRSLYVRCSSFTGINFRSA